MHEQEIGLWTPWWPTAARPWFGCFVRNQARGLAQIGCRVKVEVLRAPWEMESPAEERDLQVRQRSIPLLPRYLGAPAVWRLAGYGLRKAARGSAKGSVLVHTEILGTIAGPALAAARVPYWIVIHGEDTSERPTASRGRRNAIAKAVREATGVILVGRPLVPVAVRLGADPGRCHVIENGYDPEVDEIDCAVIPTPAAGTERLRIACVGNLQPEKGQDDLLLALRALKDQGVPTWTDFVGSGRSRRELVALAESLGVDGDVEFHGALPPRAAAEVIASADVFVLPSRREALGIVYLNAMALGKPVVGVRGTGVDSLVEDGLTGFLVAPTDPAALAGILKMLRDRPDYRLSVGAEARQVVRKRWTWAENARRTIALLGERSPV